MAMVCHMQKFKASDCGGIQAEDNRSSEDINKKNPDLDLSKTSENIHYNRYQANLYITSEASWIDCIKENRKRYEMQHGKKMRKDAVVCCSFIIGGSHDEMAAMSRERQKEYFDTAMKFFAKRYGVYNIMGMSMHFDEGTPHAHLRIYPEHPDKSVSAKKMFNRLELSRLQNDLWVYLSERGFEVGRPQKADRENKVKHLNEIDFKTQKREENLERLDMELENLESLEADIKGLLKEKERLYGEVAELTHLVSQAKKQQLQQAHSIERYSLNKRIEDAKSKARSHNASRTPKKDTRTFFNLDR